MSNLQNLAVAIASNSPGMPTGYGIQSQLLANNLLHAGADVAALSNYGLEGSIGSIKTPFGEIAHYPKGFSGYSDDVMPHHYKHFQQATPGKKHMLLTLYDVWVYTNPELDEIPIYSWTPLDHVTMPPRVENWLKKDNVTAIAMSLFGQQQMESRGIDSVYIPHAIDTNKYKPTDKIQGKSTRKFMGIDEDDFLVGMVAANKANGTIHRKAFAENLMAFAVFVKSNPTAKLYIHSDPSKTYGGFDLGNLIKAVGIPEENVLFPNLLDLRYGFTETHMAALYTAFDVLLSTSYGEGFGVPTIEAQACGTRVITSNWAASTDLVSEDSFLIDGQPFWDESQSSWFMVPKIPSILQALNNAKELPRHSEESIRFSAAFSNKDVWQNHWMPFLETI